MAFYDLREYMKACDEAGEMVTIDKEVDWNLEVGAISRRICEIGAPMAHMTNIKGVKNGATKYQLSFSRISSSVRSCAQP